jgi:hypothetical protein
MVPLPAFLLSAAGVGVALTSLAWDLLTGSGVYQFGRTQMAGCLLGAAMFGVGIWISPADRYAKSLSVPSLALGLPPWRWLATFALSAVASCLALLLPPTYLFAATSWIAWAYIAAACLILPARFGALIFLSAIVLSAVLAVINSIKVGLTGLPLTMLDIEIASANPAGLWAALKLPPWTRGIALGVIAGMFTITLLTGLICLFRPFWSESRRAAAVKSVLRCAAILGIAAMTAIHFEHLFTQLRIYRGTWEPQGLAAMAAEIGVLPYLAYSRHIEISQTGDFFKSSADTDPPTAAEVREAILQYLDFDSPSDGRSSALPNIVILLAESTFDPNIAFRLNKSVDSVLFSPRDATEATGPLLVNVIGGGTWVTEFESIVGLDSRMFGYSGYYTHASLSPYISRTLATYLKSKGYVTHAFFPHEGEFYNYRNAYHAYGFDTIFDSRDLGHSDDWTHSDTEVVDDFTRTMGSNPESPFFSYVLLVENHGPHECNVASTSEMPIRFADTDEFAPNCALHEYLRRLRSTEAAVTSLEKYLREVQRRDGRPYVLLVFGDHQPFTFTGTHMVKYDFSPFRTAVRTNVTHFHLLTSAKRRVRCCLEEIPATLLPTLVSAYAVDDPDDVYLGVNLWLFDQCGPDAVRTRSLVGLSQQGEGGAPPSAGRRLGACGSAYAQALSAFRRSGIIRFD